METIQNIYKELSNKVNEMDKKHIEGKVVNLELRNDLAKQLREIKKTLPLTFEIGDLVWIKFKRTIKGKVVGIADRDSHLYEIKPQDTVYKEEVILSDCMLQERLCDTLPVPLLSKAN